MFILCLLPLQLLGGETNYASFSISGYGFLGNRELKRVVGLLQKTPVEFYEPSFIEDAAVLIMGALRREGFLKPRITAHVTLQDSSQAEFEWTEQTRAPLPRPLSARKVRFKVREGKLFHYETLRFQGLQSLPSKEARKFFIETGLLIPLKNSRVYTPEKLRRSASALQETLQRRGYRDARVEIGELSEDEAKGEVHVTIRVVEGNKFMVRSVTKEVRTPDTNVHTVTTETNAVYSSAWAQDLKQALQTYYYERGFPDASAEVTATNVDSFARETSSPRLASRTNITEVDVVARVSTGPA
ncbi:MAG: hypothetical protein L0Y58_09755, partial [Verrucomicrobia subdivision 3 bacterium]|nr:hypothetical protein [Limisphaerales bacterium]